MKNYNSCDAPRHHSESKLVEHVEPVKSLLTGLKKISPSASAALLVGVLETVSICSISYLVVIALIFRKKSYINTSISQYINIMYIRICSFVNVKYVLIIVFYFILSRLLGSSCYSHLFWALFIHIMDL